MPIARTYMCGECSHRMEVMLDADQWDAPPPSCDLCDARETRQEFMPPKIGGSHSYRAHKLAEDIIATDYNVADAIQTATAIGKQNRREMGGVDGLDILKKSLESGAQPDLIAASRRRAIKVW